jgi:hypothetical protein
VKIAIAPAVLAALSLLPVACVDDEFGDAQFLCSPSGGADECPPDMACSEDGRCRRKALPCTPKTCEQQSPLCGELDDGCGNKLDCSKCWPGLSCGGGGVIGECGCMPKQELERAAGAFWNDATIGSVGWSDPDFARDDDGKVATAKLGATQTSNYLKAADFRFSLASTAVVEGIEVLIQRSASAEAAIGDHEVRVALEGQLLPKIGQKPETWPSTETPASYGGIGDLWDADSELPPALVSKANFGVALAVKSAGEAGSAEVDSIRVRLFVANPTCP